MCDKNIIELQNIDFGTVNDEFNWITTGSTPIETTTGQLKLKPTDQTTSFSRGLGVLDASNDRVMVNINLDFYRPQTSQHDQMDVVFGIYVGSTLIQNFTLHEFGMGTGSVITHNFQRAFKYSELSGSVSLKISVPTGFQNEIYLTDMIATNERFCEDDIRTFFVLEDFFQNAIGSVSSAIQLLEWKIDDVETLTPAFFTENNAPGGDPSTDWFLANADIDGSNRVSDVSNPNTFNPFESEFGLTFADVAGNFHGGKPTAVTSGSDYGSGIMTLGLSKPSVIDGDLESNDGAFFIDIDFSKNLKIVFNELVNNTNINVFDSPAVYKKHTIEWNANTCSKKYFYQDQLAGNPNAVVPDDQHGFLSGITGGRSLTEIVGCDQSFAYSGNSGTFEFKVDFGVAIGEAGINYDAYSVPDKFDIEWNGQIISSGYVGSNSYDQQLINLGINRKDIKTASPANGSGQLLFNKTSASPSTAIIRVHAPMGNTGWNIAGICPNGVVKTPPTVTMTTAKSTYNVQESVTFNITASDDIAIATWDILFGDGTNQSGTGIPPATIVKSYNVQGSKTATITVVDGDGLTAKATKQFTVFSDAQYQTSGQLSANCNTGMNGTVIVNSGFITVRNEPVYFKQFGNEQVIGDGAIITINDGTSDVAILSSEQQFTLGVGTYTVTSGAVDCSNGSGVVNLQIL